MMLTQGIRANMEQAIWTPRVMVGWSRILLPAGIGRSSRMRSMIRMSTRFAPFR